MLNQAGIFAESNWQGLPRGREENEQLKELARKKKQKREKEAESAAATARKEGASQIKSRSVGRPAARTPRSAFAAQRPSSSAMLLSPRG